MRSTTFAPRFVSYVLDSDLSYDSERNMFVADRSRLRNMNLFQEIYQGDKATVGFAVRRSDLAGNPRQTFYLTKTDRTGNTVNYWMFTALDRSGTRVKIINA